MELGSSYLASADILASAGGGFVVSESESPEYAGVGIDVPAGALAQDVTLTVAPTADLATVEDVEWVGPAMDFGPDGLTFSMPATITLLVNRSLGDDSPVVRAVSADGSSEWIETDDIQVNQNGTWSFPASHFTIFQPGRRPRRQTAGESFSDLDCQPGFICAAIGRCIDGSGDDLYEVAQAAGNFSTLLTTVDSLRLAGLISVPGPFTLFAPTDAAFASLPVNLSVVDSAIVENIIFNHIAFDEFDAAALTAAAEVTTIAKVTHAFGGGTVRSARIATADVAASNGIIHVLDDVIVPPTILETVAARRFTQLSAALAAASPATRQALDPDTLGGAAPVTLFAPLDSAFEAANLAGENLDAVLATHVVAGQITSGDLTPGRVFTTLSGSRLTVGTEGRPASLTDERGNTFSVIFSDTRTLTGVLHVIDGVLLPARP